MHAGGDASGLRNSHRKRELKATQKASVSFTKNLRNQWIRDEQRHHASFGVAQHMKILDPPLQDVQYHSEKEDDSLAADKREQILCRPIIRYVIGQVGKFTNELLRLLSRRVSSLFLDNKKEDQAYPDFSVVAGQKNLRNKMIHGSYLPQNLITADIAAAVGTDQQILLAGKKLERYNNIYNLARAQEEGVPAPEVFEKI